MAWSKAMVTEWSVETPTPTFCGSSDCGITGADSGPACVTGVCWLNAMMRMNERVANETRVRARWRLSSVPSDSNGAAVAALTVRIGRNRQTPWEFRPASAGARAGSESGGGSIAHAYQARHTKIGRAHV